MVHYYTSLNSNTTVEFNKNSGKTIASSTGFKSIKSSWFVMISMLLSMTIGQKTWAQSTVNYAFTTNATGSLAADINSNAIDMSTGTTQLVAADLDDSSSAATNIGFNFVMFGNNFSQFTASSNGVIQLGSAALSTTTYVLSGGTTTTPRIGAFAADLRTGSSGKVHYKLVGTAPNRCLVVEFLNMSLTFVASPGSNDGTYQVRLYESTGVIEYVYGTMFRNASTTSTAALNVGFSVGSAANTTASITTSTNTVSTGATFNVNSYTTSASIPNLDSSSNGSRRVYKFTPPTAASANPTALTFTAITATTTTPNWVDSSTNETGFVVTRALDAGFTTGVVFTSVATTTSAGTGTAYTSIQSGLTPGTTYFYKIQAMVEGGGGTGITGSQATTAGTIYYWVGPASAGLWSAAANWNTNPAGGGTTRTSILTSDILVVDGAVFAAGAATSISVDTASFSIGQLQIISNTACTLASSTTTRTITIIGGGGDDFIITNGSSLTTNNASLAIAFVFSGTGHTANIAGTYNIGGSTSNAFASTGGTSTLVTIAGTGIINNAVAAASGNFTGSTATMTFANGSQYNVSGATTGAPAIPLATWGATSTITVTGITTSTSGPTNAAQSFGNLVYNCPSATGTMSFFVASTATIQGDLTITAAGAIAGTGIFRALTSGTLTVNGNVVVTQGRLQSASSTGTLIVLGNTTNSVNGIIDILAGTYSQRGTTFTNNGTLTGVSSSATLQFFSPTNVAQTFAGSGTVLTNVGAISLQNTSGLTITHTNTIPTLRVNLFNGNITNSNKITIGTGAALPTTVQIGYPGNVLAGGSFDVAPTFNLGTGTHGLIYAQELASRTTGLEIPVSRSLSFLTLSNSNGLTISGGALATTTLTFSALSGGNITTSAANLLTVTGTLTTNVVRTLATAYVNGPLVLTLPASLPATTYTFPIGKSALNTFALVNATTNAGGTVTVRAEAFDGNPAGTAGTNISAVSTTRYWAASITAGAANFTNSLIQLNDTTTGRDAIAGSATVNGAYDLQGGVAITTTPTSLTTTAPANTTLPGFFLMANKAAASLANLAISPTGNQCANVARTVTVNVTPGGGAVTGVVINYTKNGIAQTAITMTNTTNNGGLLMDTWSGVIPTVTPVNATIAWSVTATDVNLLTKTQSGTSYSDAPLTTYPAIATASVPAICGSGTSLLTATLGGTVNGTIGTDTTLTSATTQPTAFCNRWPSYRMQTVYTAAELTAAGLSAGNITSMAFNVTTLGDGATNAAFVVQIGTTALSTLSGAFVSTTGFTTVYPSQTYTHTASGLQTIPFSTPFVWDGTSNIIVDMVHNGANATNNSITYYTATAGNTVAYTTTASSNSASFSTQRLNVVFTTVSNPVVSSVLWSNGDTGATTTVTPSTTTGYSATITSGGCTKTTNTVTVTINPIPTAPAANVTTGTCGAGIPLVSVSDPNAFTTPTYKWYASNVAPTALQTSTSTTYTTSINTTTPFYVSVINPTTLCESTRTLITANVNPPDTIVASASFAEICLGSSVDLTATTTTNVNSNSYAFTWSAGAGSGITTSVSGGTGSFGTPATISRTPTAAGTYVYTLNGTDSVQGCNAIASTVSVTVKALPNLSISPITATVCSGNPITLTAINSTVNNGTATIGTQTTTEFGGSVYRHGAGNSDFRHQLLYKASELSAAQINAGPLTSLAFNITSLGTTTYTNYTISLANVPTSTTALSTTFNASTLTQVYTIGTTALTAGINTYTFGTGAGSTGFTWDGTSNILVNICYTVSGSNSSSTVAATTPSFIGNTQLLATAGACTNTTGTTFANRPLAIFGGGIITINTVPLNYSWDTLPVTGVLSATNTLTQSPTSSITYQVTGSYPSGAACPNTATKLVTVNPLPTAPTTSGTLSQCGPVVPSAATLTVADSNGFTTPTFKWYATNVTTTALQSSTATKYNSVVSATTTLFVSVVNPTTLCESARTSVTITVITQPTVSVLAVTPIFCGTGGSTDITATVTGDPGTPTFSWSTATSGATVNSGATTATINGTITQSSVFTVVVTPTNAACAVVTTNYTVSFYPLPDATLTSSVNGVCPGTTAIIGSGLSAGNFSSTATTFAPLTAPGTATTLVSAGVINVTPDLSYGFAGDLDDAGWSAIPINFPFSFFGTTYNTVSISTNGTIFMGTASDADVADFTFTTLPSTGEPFKMVAALAMDNNLAGATGGAIKYWTEGTSPNRKFVISYEAVQEYADTKFSTTQAIFYETTGIVDVHVTSSTNQDRNKLVGINNGDGTIGQLAFASGTTAAANNPIVTSFAYRFSPPSNYTTTWYSKLAGALDSTYTQFATGTNLFSQSVSPTVSTTYQLSYQNQITLCNNNPALDTVTLTILDDVAPTDATTVSNVPTVCLNGTANLSLTSPSSLSGLTYQWEVSIDNGGSFAPIPLATNATVTVTPTTGGVSNTYRCRMLRCTGTVPSYSSNLSIGFTNVVATAPDVTRCGTGTVSLTATATGNFGVAIKWYSAETGGTLLSSTTPYVATVSASTTVYAAAESTSPTCVSPRRAVAVTVTTAPALTINETSPAVLCTGATQAITLTGGSVYNTFAWSPAVTEVTPGSSYNVAPTASTTYTLTATQTSGSLCAIIVPFTVNVTTVDVTASANPSTPVCPGASVTLTASSLLTGPTGLPGTYCVPVHSGSSQVSNVTFNSLSNTDNQSSPYYTIYPATGTNTTTVNTGQTYALNVTSSSASIASVWIDYNRNGIFEATEWQQLWTSATSGTINVTIPTNATVGQTAMRIRTRTSGNTNGDVDACSSFGSGSAKDFTITIQTNNASLNTYAWTEGASPTVLGTGLTYTAMPSVTTDYYVTATSIVGSCTKQSKITVTVNSNPISTISSANGTSLCLGSPTIPSTIDFNTALNTEVVVWTSSNPAVATIDSGNGTLTGIAPGTTTIRAQITDPGAGSCVTYSNSVVFNVYAPVVITTQPIARNIIENGFATFTVAATGSGPGGFTNGITYQWYVSNASNDLGSPITDLTGVYAGATTNQLRVDDTAFSQHDKYFTCVITGSAPCASPVESTRVRLVVNNLTLSNPTSVSICSPASTASFTVTTNLVLSTVEAPNANTVIWSVDTGSTVVDITSTSQTIGGIPLTFTGISSTTLGVSDLTTACTTWKFRVRIYDDNSETTLTSGDAVLTISTIATLNNSPSVNSVCYTGGSTTFFVDVTNALSIKWQFSTTGGTSDVEWTDITAGLTTGATYSNFATATLGIATTNSLVAAGPYYYRAYVTSFGTCDPVKTLAYQMTVNTPTVAITPPTNTYYCNPGGTAVSLVGTGGATYTWASIPSGTYLATAGISVSPLVNTSYTVTGTDASGCSNTATIAITAAAGITSAATATPQTVCSAGLVQLSAGIESPTTPGPTASNYVFAGSTGTYATITGTSLIGTTMLGDDVGVGNLPIGFTFNYNNSNETVFDISSNGFIELGQTSATLTSYGITNALASNAKRIAPLWDDNNTTGGSVIYATTGLAGSRVLTVQWTGMHVGASGSSSQPTIDAQVRLYEGSGKIEFIYGATSAALTSTTASIGLSSAVGNYLSVTPLSPASSSTKSSTTENTGISSATNIPTGTIYTFTKPPVSASYAWTTTETVSTLSSTTLENPTANPTGASGSTYTYTVLATTAAGCTATSNVTVTIQTGVVITDSPKVTTKCVGQPASFSVLATGAGLTYAWFKSGNATAIAGQTTATLSFTAVALTDAGDYYVTITPTCGAPVSTTPVALTVNPLPTAAISGTANVCLNGTSPSITFTGGAGTAPYTFTYKINGGADLTATGNPATVTAPTGTAGTFVYTLVSVFDSSATACSQTQTGSATITVNGLPTVPTISSNSPVCSGNALNLATPNSLPYSLNNNSGVAFVDISTSGTSVGTVSDDSEHNVTIPSFPFNGVAYTTARIGNNGVLVFGTTTGDIIYTNSALPQGIAAGTFSTSGLITGTGNSLAAICANWDDMTTSGTVTTSIKTQTIGTKYIVQWTNEDNFNATGTGTITFQIQLDSSDGKIHLVYPDITYGAAGFDGGASATVGLNYSATSALQYSFNTASLVTNQSLTFTPGTVYSSTSWSGPNSFISAAQNPSIVSATTAATGNYTLEITNVNGCKATSAPLSVTVNQTPSATIVSNGGAICSGSTATFTVTGTAGATLSYTITGQSGTQTLALSGSSQTITASNATANVTLTLSSVTLATCSSTTFATGSSTVTVNSLPTATISGTTTVCQSATSPSVTFTGANGTTPYTFTYTLNGGSNQTIATTSGSSVSLSAPTTTAGVFTYALVSVAGGNNCSQNQTGSAVITVTSTNTVSLSSAVGTNAQSVCIDTSITDITFATTGATGATFSGLPAGVTGSWLAGVATITGAPTVSGLSNYTVTLTGGCGNVTATGTITVTSNTVTLSSAVGTDAQTTCLSTPITTITYATTGATGATFIGLPAGVTGSWSGNVVTISGTPTETGNFSYKVTLTGGCGTAIAMGSITVNAPTAHTTTATACGTYTWAAPLGDGNTYTTSQTGLTHVSTNAAGCSHTETLNLSITSCSSVVNLKLFIQGYYDPSTTSGVSMRSVRFNQTNNDHYALTAPTDEVELLTVELYDPATMLLVPGASTTAMLKTDGTMVCNFSSAPSGSYYLTVKGSNMVQVWTATPVTVGATALNYDFSTSLTKSYDEDNLDSLRTMVELVNDNSGPTGVWALYSGDIQDPLTGQQDLNVDNADYSLFVTDYNDGNYGVYPANLSAPTDLNGDGNVDNADYAIWEGNYNDGVYSHTPPTP